MSKVTLKKYLGTLEKSEIIDVVLDLYDARKEAKECLDYFLNPDEKAKMNEYKAILPYHHSLPRGSRQYHC